MNVQRTLERGMARTYRHRIERGLAEARQADRYGRLFVQVHLYCEHDGCVVREVDLVVKEHEGPLSPALLCPACRHQLKPHAPLVSQ